MLKKKQEPIREEPEKPTTPPLTGENGGEEEQAVPGGAGRDAEKIRADIAHFEELFPEVKPEEIPNEVWQAVEAGESLTGAYAVFFVETLRKKEAEEKENAAAEEEHRRKAPPRVKDGGERESVFDPEKVKNMSREEVRRHYGEILEAMKQWH